MITFEEAFEIAKKHVAAGSKIIVCKETKSFFYFIDSSVEDGPIGYTPIGVMKEDGKAFGVFFPFYVDELQAGKIIDISSMPQ